MSPLEKAGNAKLHGEKNIYRYFNSLRPAPVQQHLDSGFFTKMEVAMPTGKRIATKYPGVFYIEGTALDGKPEKIYYIRYRKGGKPVEEKAGRQFQDDMTPARASQKRTRKIRGDELTNQERRDAEEARKKAQAGKWTIDKLWQQYESQKPDTKARRTDKSRYEKYLKPKLGEKEPPEILQLDVDRIRLKIQKKKSPQTVKHVLALLKRIVNYGLKKGLCQGMTFKIDMPKVYNVKDDDLRSDQLKSLLAAIEKDSNVQVGNMMKLALFTGMRRGEIFKLKWSDIQFEKGFIHIRDPKGGPSQKIPLNDAARQLLNSHPKTEGSEFVFPGQDGKQRQTADIAARKIRKAAGLPKGFRPFHGLRHTYASILASSGQVDMYTLQKLMTHKSPVMTQRYAHLRDEALQRAASTADELIQGITKGDEKGAEVVTLQDHQNGK